MVRSDGVQVKFVISYRVYEAFKAEIGVEHPFIYKGLLSSQAEIAFQEFIVNRRKRRSSMQQGTRQEQNVKMLEDLIELRDNIIQYMLSHQDCWPDGPRKYIIEKHLFESIGAIKAVRDKRTIKKWIDRLFREAGLIRRNGSKEYQFWDPGKEEP